jgi:hypothetical protein
MTFQMKESLTTSYYILEKIRTLTDESNSSVHLFQEEEHLVVYSTSNY